MALLESEYPYPFAGRELDPNVAEKMVRHIEAVHQTLDKRWAEPWGPIDCDILAHAVPAGTYWSVRDIIGGVREWEMIHVQGIAADLLSRGYRVVFTRPQMTMNRVIHPATLCIKNLYGSLGFLHVLETPHYRGPAFLRLFNENVSAEVMGSALANLLEKLRPVRAAA